MKKIIGTLILFFALHNTSWAAQEEVVISLPKILKPIDCEIGKDCWVANYVDMDINEEHQDYKCDKKTYNAHSGTDFALKDMLQMQKGVDVIAPLAGTIKRVRNDQTDTIKNAQDLEVLKNNNKACGNGLLIDHNIAGYPGLRSVFCHLKKDSIKVEEESVVAAGDIIAQVGHSGDTSFPHLHYALVWEGRTLDPFLGHTLREDKALCERNTNPNGLWKNEIPYEVVSIFSSGFDSKKPSFKNIISGKNKQPDFNNGEKTLAYWAGFFGLNTGDIIQMKILDPRNKQIVTRTIEHKAPHARQYYFTGKKLKNYIWRGSYTAEVKVIRNDELLATQTETLSVN